MKSIIQKIVLIFLIVLSISPVEAQQQDAKNPSLSLTMTAFTSKMILTDLFAENFEIYLENRRAEIESLTQKNQPVSIGFLIDSSGSMSSNRNNKRDRMAFSSASFSKFLENANPENDYFVMTFDKSVNIILDTTQEGEKVKDALVKISENKMNASKTEFYKALTTAYEKIGKSKNVKKVLILITDAQDNGSSKLDFNNIKKLLKRENVLLYAIRVLPEESPRYSRETLISLQNVALFERDWQKIQLLPSPLPAETNIPFPDSLNELDEIVSLTGGRIFFPLTQKEVDDSFRLLADELKSQYDLVFKVPEFKKNDFNEVKIKFIEQKDKKVGKVTVRARKGFYF